MVSISKSDLLKHFLIPGYTTTQAIKATSELISKNLSKPVSELEEMAKKAEIEAATFIIQAKVEQELSIARRILCAEEVEIEEFYDLKGKGFIGSKADKVLQFGVSGEGQRVSRRIIKFKGFNQQIIESEDTEESLTIQSDSDLESDLNEI